MKKKSEKSVSTGRRSTVHDIARATGVSIGTVSRALNNKPGVHPKTRELVLSVSREMNVKSRAGARRRQVAILVADRKVLDAETYAGALCAHLSLELSRRDMFGMYILSEERERLTREIFDGIITTSWLEEDLAVLRGIRKTPIIMARCCRHGDEFHLASWDHRAEGALVAEYFIRHGHRRLAMLHMDPGDPFSLELRWQGFFDRATELKLAASRMRYHILESRGRMAPLLKKLVEDGVDGVWMPGHQYVAAEGLKILQEVIGARVPADISVIGSENPGISELLQPSLTSVAAPFTELAEGIVDQLVDYMDAGGRSIRRAPILLLPSLLERDSVADRKK